jgi:hypothetical protein
MGETKSKVKLAEALRAEAAALEAQAAAKRAQAEALAEEPRDEYLNVEQTLEHYNAGRDALIAAAERGEIELKRGARRQLLVLRSELERWIASRPYKPTPRKVGPPSDLDAWEKEADRALAGGAR